MQNYHMTDLSYEENLICHKISSKLFHKTVKSYDYFMVDVQPCCKKGIV